MRNYFVKTPWWLKKLYPNRVWDIDTNEKIIYLTFDDGPHPIATPFVLDELKKYNATATFFCIGKNVLAYPEIYQRILKEGHAPGNHTNDHLNGWQTDDGLYLENVAAASAHIRSSLFRPPYGKMRSSQAKKISGATGNVNTKIVMWDVLSGDFDGAITADECLNNVIVNASKGSTIVFHDSEKAFHKLKIILPEILNFFTKENYMFRRIEVDQ